MWGRSRSVCFLKCTGTFFPKTHEIAILPEKQQHGERETDNLTVFGPNICSTILDCCTEEYPPVATGQWFIYQNDLIFQSIKSVISNWAHTTSALLILPATEPHSGQDGGNEASLLLCTCVYDANIWYEQLQENKLNSLNWCHLFLSYKHKQPPSSCVIPVMENNHILIIEQDIITASKL